MKSKTVVGEGMVTFTVKLETACGCSRELSMMADEVPDELYVWLFGAYGVSVSDCSGKGARRFVIAARNDAQLIYTYQECIPDSGSKPGVMRPAGCSAAQDFNNWKIHTHPMMQSRLGVPDDHVIVDRENLIRLESELCRILEKSKELGGVINAVRTAMSHGTGFHCDKGTGI